MQQTAIKLADKSIPRSDRKSLLGFSFLHFLNDLHSTALPTIIPMLVDSISMTLSQAGLLSALFGITHFLGQPIAGYFADRQKKACFAVWAPLLSIAGATFLPLSQSYIIALMLVGLMSIGTACFHPQGLGRSGSSARNKDIALSISIFAAFGSLGGAIGPLYVVFLISVIGKNIFPIVLVPSFIICLYIWKNIVSEQDSEEVITEKAQFRGFFSNTAKLIKNLFSVIVVATFRDATLQGIKIFLPMLLILRGETIAVGGMLIFAITIASTIAGLVAGKLADTINDEKVMLGTLAISPIFLYTGLNTTGVVSVTTLITGFAFLHASTPITTAIAQKRCPLSRSTASSLAMGLSWGIANLFVSLVGFSADIIGLGKTLQIVTFLPWIITAWYTYEIIFSKNIKNIT